MLSPTEIAEIMEEIEAGTYDLESALDDIAVEQRGELVRKALYAGILLVNMEGHAGAVDPTARLTSRPLKEEVEDRLASMEAQMAEFLSTHSGVVQASNITTTTLWSGKANVSGTIIEFAEAANTFDYLTIYYTIYGRRGRVLVKPSDLQNGIYLDGEAFNVESQAASPAPNGTAKIKIAPESVGTYTRYEVTSLYYTWDGKASTASVTQATQSNWNYGILGIEGIKIESVDTTAKDAELTDLRIGYDGTEYNSAGEAIRAQINDLYQQLAAIDTSSVTVDSNGYLRFDGGASSD